jgi:flagellar hook-basal body complex protein FliE
MTAVPINAIGSLANEWSVGSVGGLGNAAKISTDAAASSQSGGFAGALTQAIGSLQQTQDTANTAAVQLATGQTSDPTTAITDVENAQLTMELASQITSKAVMAIQTIFQTQA